MDQAALRVGMSESTATAGGALELSSSTRTDGKKKIINIHITCTCAMFLGSGYSCSVDTSVATYAPLQMRDVCGLRPDA